MEDEIKRLAVLGSTGSIGRQTLDVVRALPRHFRIIALAAGKNLDLLAEQVAEFKPEFISYFSGRDENGEVEARLASLGGRFLPLEEMAAHPQVDTVVMATAGKAGLAPTLAAVKAGKNIALANKESLVMAGEIVTRQAKLSGARLLPVDSEHSAIWQCLAGENQAPHQIILTASGGPFRDFTPAQLEKVTVAQALAHPSWRMGKKVTIDSATLMNKGLEVIEAHWLFDMPFDRIRVLVHPRSIVHSLVEFADGSVKAQLSRPDMRLPIQYALSYPDRLPNPQLPRLDWDEFDSLTFSQPDLAAFPCLGLAIEAGRKGGTYPAVLCAADEVAVELFLSERIAFVDIAATVERTLAQHDGIARPTLEEVLAADEWAREEALKTAAGVKS
ncbi:MAG: 1-deoxy-D-xylulose-5-phosphate reductoisomerase [Chloroflexi bacterium]|nr:1-deoxy-D-xylulose-5-phosphate reductoisomerase [Chloroflexota bacterium]